MSQPEGHEKKYQKILNKVPAFSSIGHSSPKWTLQSFQKFFIFKNIFSSFSFFWGGGHFLEWAPLPLVAEGRDDHRCREKDRGTICNRGSLTRRQPMALMWCKQQQEVTECDKKNTRHEKGERN